jgi:hypothetical protein
LLALLCRHVDCGNVLARAVSQTDPEDRRYGRLTAMAARESAMVAVLSQKLRLTPQANIRSDKKIPTLSLVKPWDKHGPAWGTVP